MKQLFLGFIQKSDSFVFKSELIQQALGLQSPAIKDSISNVNGDYCKKVSALAGLQRRRQICKEKHRVNVSQWQKDIVHHSHK